MNITTQKRVKMNGTELTKFREKTFPGKMSKEKMAVAFGVKYHTMRRYEGNNPLPIPEVLSNAIKFYAEKEELKSKLAKMGVDNV